MILNCENNYVIHCSCDIGGTSIYLDHNIEEAVTTLCNPRASSSYSFNTSQQYVYVRAHSNVDTEKRGFSRAEFTSYGLFIVVRNCNESNCYRY